MLLHNTISEKMEIPLRLLWQNLILARQSVLPANLIRFFDWMKSRFFEMLFLPLDHRHESHGCYVFDQSLAL